MKSLMKHAIEELAVLGGAPAFPEKLHVGRPNIGSRERFLQRVNDILDRRWLTNHGKYVQEFEQQIAARLGVRHCIAVCNATVALELVIRASGLSGEVIVPAFTFIATAHALQWQEITPVFCDVDPHTHNLDPNQVERMITPRTTGIIGVHIWGRACDVAALADIARRRNLKLLFDAAHAFGSSYRGQMIGGFGDAEVFSFHATKFLNSFEGGAVATNNDELAKKLRLMKNFGFAGYDNVIYIGTNGKMTEVAAAMGLTSLESMDEFIATNRRNYELYREELRDVPGIRMVTYDGAERYNYQYIVVEVDEVVAHVGRDALVRLLWAENVMARRYFHPGCHRMEPYRSYYPHAGLLLPHTERLCDRVLLLPNGTALRDEEVRTVCQLVRLGVRHGSEARLRLNRARVAAKSGV
jgi:dTDP-4-amino-4,6-dideoxygalactose transaminase